jgi:hypothetical protein
MRRKAVICNGIVKNVEAVEVLEEGDIDGEGAALGDFYDGEKFIRPEIPIESIIKTCERQIAELDEELPPYIEYTWKMMNIPIPAQYQPTINRKAELRKELEELKAVKALNEEMPHEA